MDARQLGRQLGLSIINSQAGSPPLTIRYATCTRTRLVDGTPLMDVRIDGSLITGLRCTISAAKATTGDRVLLLVQGNDVIVADIIANIASNRLWTGTITTTDTTIQHNSGTLAAI